LASSVSQGPSVSWTSLISSTLELYSRAILETMTHPFLENRRLDYLTDSAQAGELSYERSVTDFHSITRGTSHFLVYIG